MTDIQTEISRSGHPTIRMNGVWLHSRFDPVREARRYAEEQVPDSARLVLIIAPGLGYLVEAIRTLRPGCTVACIWLSETLASHSVARPDHAHTFETLPALRSYLNAAISDLDTAGLAIVTWEPTAGVFPERSRIVLEAVHEFVTRAQASLVTEGATGRRWIRNFVHNFTSIEPLGLVRGGRRISAVVVAGAGPSLESSTSLLRAVRDRVAVFATASALLPLLYRGIRPDLVALTDASVYAALHLREAIAHTVPVTASLSASRILASLPGVLPLNEGTPLEDALLPDSVPRIPPAGTVTSTLLRLARMLTSAPIVCAGIDLGWIDARTHARPHANELFTSARRTRLSPPVQPPVTGAGPRTGTGVFTQPVDLATYAPALVSLAAEQLAPVSVLEPSAAWDDAIADGTISENARDVLSDASRFDVPLPGGGSSLPPRSQRVEAVRAALTRVLSRVHDDDDTTIREFGVRLALPQLVQALRREGSAQRTVVRDRIQAEIEDLLESLA